MKRVPILSDPFSLRLTLNAPPEMQCYVSLVWRHYLLNDITYQHFFLMIINEYIVLLSLLPAGAGGCSCGWQRWVEVVLAWSCRETQTALCRRWCRAGEPSSLIVLPTSHCSPPVRLKVMNILLLPCHLLAPPFPSYMCVCLTSTSVCTKANYVFVLFCWNLLLCCHQCRLYILF